LLQRLVDDAILELNREKLMWGSVILLFIITGQAFLSYLFTYSTGYLGQSIVRDLRVSVFEHIISLNLGYFDRTPIGTPVTRTISDIEAINDVFSDGLITILSDLLTIIVIVTVMFLTSWKLTLLCLSVLPVLLVAAYFFKEGVRKSFTEVRNQVALLNSFLQEHISGMSVVQLFTAQKREYEKFKAINKAHRDANIKSIWYYSTFFPVVELVSAMALSLVVWYVARHAISGEVTIGILFSFILFINLLFRPIRMLADKFNTLQMGMVAADRVFKLIDFADQMPDHGTLSTGQVRGAIEFSNVNFSYEGKKEVLKNISFAIEAGKTLAIVGHTGSGKTSLVNLLNRFYRHKSGRITIDGMEIENYKLSELRGMMSFVLQDVFLFSGSVMDNITLRNGNISREQAMEAARICGIHDWIMKLPGGYDYKVLERGSTLSAGQRQLISFVRALVMKPKILILDEATSSIDTESEILIQRAIEKLIRGRTSLVIAHRLSTIRHADQILLLDKGEVKEAGTHRELMDLKGSYHKLFLLQFSEQVTAS
jgi:ATP-binding cassette subfamily B protein